jgi:hypothetical protein
MKRIIAFALVLAGLGPAVAAQTSGVVRGRARVDAAKAK